MGERIQRVFLALAVIVLGLMAVASGQRYENSSSQEGPRGKQKQEDSVALGKKLFLERCSSCHNEDGRKPLRTGPPLSDRNLTLEQIQKAVNGRFREKTAEEKRAVSLFIQSLLKH